MDWQIAASPALAAAFGVAVPMGFGNDFAGVIDAVGDGVSRWAVGDRVFGGARVAALADHVVLADVDPRLHRTPDGVDDRTAGVIDIAGRTASAVVDALTLTRDDTVLISAAAGGVGSLLVQLAVRTGARVIGTGSPASAAVIAGLGAEPVGYGSGLADEVGRLAPAGITAAADLFDARTAEVALQLGVPPRRVVTIESDAPPPGTRAVNGSDARPGALLELLELVAAGHLRVPVAATFPLERFAEAIELQRRRHTHGKLAVELLPT